MKRKKLINKFSLPANAGWSATQNKTAMPSTITPLFRKVILCTLLPLLLLGAVKTAAQDYSKALVNVDNVSDDGSLHLDGARSVTTAVVAGATYLFVAGSTDDGVSVFRVDDGGLLTNRANVSDGDIRELDGATSVTTAVVEGTTYLFVAGSTDDGVSVFSVANNGLLASVTNVTDDTGSLELDGANSVTTAVVDGTTYLFVAGYFDDGVSVFSVASNGLLANVTNVTDAGSLELDGAASVTTAVVDGTTYLFVAGNRDDGVSVFNVANNGLLAGVTNVPDDSSLELDRAFSVTTAVVDGTTYLFVAGSLDDGVSVFSVANNGLLTNRANVTDAGTLELDGALSVTTAVVDGTTCLFVAGSTDDGVSVFSVANNGLLANVTNVTDAGSLELDGAYSVTTAVVADTTYLFVAGRSDDGVSVFRVEDAAAPTFGSQTASDQTFAISCGDVSLQLPEATSGNGTLTYTLTPAIPGLTLDPVTGMLSGTPATASAAVMLTYTVTDQDYNLTDDDSHSFTFMVTVTANNTAPAPDAVSLSALTGECMVNMPAAPTATDNCDTGTITGTTTTNFPVTSTSVITWTFTDMAGNGTTQTQQVTITDDATEPDPDMTSLPALTGECMVDMPAAPTATDNCDTGTITGTTTTNFPVTSTSVITWTFTDMAGNGTTQTQQVTITDDATEPDPDMPSLPALTGECMVDMPAAPTATDNCDTGTITGTTTTNFPVTSTSVITWTFTDMAGNGTAQTQQVTITDDATEPDPDMPSLPALTGECMVNMSAAPTATDICDGIITGITTASFPVTSTSVIMWTFTDMAGNMIIQTQQVTISDVIAPDPDMPSLPALTGECMVNMSAAPTATDICAGTITGITTTIFPVTTDQTITWTYEDNEGNMITQTQQVTITGDVTAPDPDMPALPALTGECMVNMPAAPTATDICDGSITGTTDAMFPVTANSVVTWTFTDMTGNVITQTQEVILMDVTAPDPDMPSLPALTGECMVNTPADPTATDNCDGNITGITTTIFPVTADQTITWTYEDNEGNMITQTQIVTISDVTAPDPDMTSLPALTGECSVMPADPTATDICAGTITGITTTIFPVTTDQTITWTYEDNEGNMITQTQMVTISDVTAPDPDMTSLPALTGECSVMPADPTATDICAGTITGITTTIFPVTTDQTITWAYEDNEGNMITQTQMVTISDVTAPDPDMTSLPALTGECSVMPADPTATDNCDGSITGITTTIFPVTADQTITWTFTDMAGNMATQDQQVTLNCIPPLGVEEEPGISMYPNPSEGSLAFSTANYGSLSIKIYRIDGALVFAGIARDNTPINIETLAVGSYVVQAASSGTTVFTSRLFKRDQGLFRD